MRDWWTTLEMKMYQSHGYVLAKIPKLTKLILHLWNKAMLTFLLSQLYIYFSSTLC